MTDHIDRCTAPQTPSLRLAVGAYVLGALDPAETDQVTAHLDQCPSCHQEYLNLLDLVPLLACVTETAQWPADVGAQECAHVDGPGDRLISPLVSPAAALRRCLTRAAGRWSHPGRAARGP